MLPPYKKLQPLISAFIKNSIFGNNRDPCIKSQFFFDASPYSAFLKKVPNSKSCIGPPAGNPIHRAFSLGATGVMTDYPSRLQKFLAKKAK